MVIQKVKKYSYINFYKTILSGYRIINFNFF